MSFHIEYLDLIKQLPPSLVQQSWRWLTTRKKIPISEDKAGNINPIIESFLKHEVEMYQQRKQRKWQTHISSEIISLSDKIETNISNIQVPIENSCETVTSRKMEIWPDWIF